jgi:hypothetical protein
VSHRGHRSHANGARRRSDRDPAFTPRPQAQEITMNATITRWSLPAAWLVVVGLLYQLVPATLSLANFLFIAAVLLLLVGVAFLKGRRGATHESMSDALYNMDHPSADRKP